jgi:hypothetical protein
MDPDNTDPVNRYPDNTDPDYMDPDNTDLQVVRPILGQIYPRSSIEIIISVYYYYYYYSYYLGTGSLPGVKRPGRCVGHTPSFSSVEVKESVGLNLFSPSEPSWPIVW